VSRLQAPPLRLAGLHLLVLWSFAVAQPLFDLLGRNGEFFAARGSTRWDIVVFGLVLLLALPALLLGIEAVTPRGARGAVHAAIVALLLGLFALQVLARGGAPGWLLVLLAALAGAAGGALYARAHAARTVLTVLAPAPLLFLALFLFHSDASRLTFAGADTALAAGEHPRGSAVLVTFDELPINSLLAADGRIDAARYPNFARLARESTWIANASTVAEGTTHAVPAILTGRFPQADELPVYSDHKQNLFTLLAERADLHVADDETHLCPPRLCPGLEGSFGGRMRSLAEDTGVVYLHELLPDDLATGVPSIGNGWANFLRDASPHHDPGNLPPAFISSLRPVERPTLWYVHLMLPHSPWGYLPSGRPYSVRPAPGWGGDEVWNGNQGAVDQWWQRHLLQAGYADRVLGRLLDRLGRAGLYERATLVVTADHGVSFHAGEKRRPLSEANLEDNAYVPLFVRTPGRREGLVEGAPARTIDILPTLAAALGVMVPWQVDGHSLLGPRPREQQVVLIKDHGRRFSIPAGELQEKRERALRRQLQLFGSGASSLFAVGPYRSLLGRKVAGPAVEDLDPIDRSGPLVQISGHANGRSVAVVGAGRAVAVGPVVHGRFWMLVPRAHAGPGIRVVSLR
jgi:hypothetical protein